MKTLKSILVRGWLLVISLFFSLQPCDGQSTRFSEFYDTNAGADAFLDVEKTVDGNLVIVGRSLNLTDNPGRNDGIHVIVDLDGQTIAEHRYSFIGESFNPSAIMRSDYSNSLYSAGYYCVGDPGYCDFYFSMLDASGDTVFISQISRQDTGDVLLNMIETAPNKIMLIGWTYNDTTDTNADLLFITVDTLGNELNRVVYGGGGTDYVHSGLRIDEDGHVLMVGYTKSYPSINSGRSWVVKTDSIGNVLWHRTYSGIGGLSASGIGLDMLPDENVIISGGRSGNGYLQKIDTAGSQIWIKQYNVDGAQGLWGVVGLDDGIIVSCGVTDDGNDQAGWLIKTDENGDTLWTRTYDPSDGTDYLRNMLVMPNGDIVMVGFGRGENSTTQDGWILRVDSMGCLVENCFTVGVEQLEQKEHYFTVYPNPASALVQIQRSSLKLQGISVRDVMGREMTSPNPSLPGGEFLQLDVSNWPNGVYLVSVTNEQGNNFTQRLVVQH